VSKRSIIKEDEKLKRFLGQPESHIKTLCHHKKTKQTTNNPNVAKQNNNKTNQTATYKNRVAIQVSLHSTEAEIIIHHP
jgi:hypothetical protein